MEPIAFTLFDISSKMHDCRNDEGGFAHFDPDRIEQIAEEVKAEVKDLFNVENKNFNYLQVRTIALLTAEILSDLARRTKGGNNIHRRFRSEVVGFVDYMPRPGFEHDHAWDLLRKWARAHDDLQI